MHYLDTQTAEGLTSGDIVADWFDEGIRIIIMRGPASFCTYLGVPSSHPLAGQSYDNLPIHCHGGLTFSQEGVDRWPVGFYWYGYDYAHAGDYTDFNLPPELKNKFPKNPSDKNWTLGEVKKDTWSALYDMHRLMNLAESIASKTN